MTDVIASTRMRHVTLTTGHSRDSERSEIDDGALAICADLIAHIGSGKISEPVAIPGCAGYSLSGRTAGKCMVATVWADGPPSEMVVSIGIAAQSPCGAAIWRTLHQVTAMPAATDPDQQPPAPWCGVVIEPALARHTDAAHWLGDFERCLAWAWLEICDVD